VSFGLRKALSKENIQKGFKTTGIYPLNNRAMNDKMGPSLSFSREGEKRTSSQVQQGDVECSYRVHDPSLEQWQIEEIYEENVDVITIMWSFW